MKQSLKEKIQQFIKQFDTVCPSKHRRDVFVDFVTICAISLHNAVRIHKPLEEEYLSIVGKYSKQDVKVFTQLFAQVVDMLNPTPYDVLGTLYMDLGLGNAKNGQFFTPFHISEFMAHITYGESLDVLNQEYITVSDPACGAGSMVLAFAKILIEQKHIPSEKMWAQCIDIDRTVALMCYVQLSLWHIPAEVVVGNSLSLEIQEVWHTPAHYLGFWEYRLKQGRDSKVETVTGGDADEVVEAVTTETVQSAIAGQQFSIDFGK